MGRITHTTATLAVLAALALAACGGEDNDSSSSDTTRGDDASGDVFTDVPAATQPPRDGAEVSEVEESAAGQPGAGESTAGSSAPSAPLGLDTLGRAIAIEAGVTIGTPNIRQAVDDTLDVVARNNGNVYSADVNIGDEHDDGSVDGAGSIVVKVPPVDLDPMIAELDGTAGVLLGRTQTSDDVTEQLIDLDIRIGVERATIAQFETLLAAATEFSDIVAVQAVLSEHTVTLEQLLASQRNVDQRVELSTLTIDLTYVAPDSTVGDPAPVSEDDGISDAFGTGWDAFTGAAMAVVIVLAVVAPFLALAAVVIGAVWLIASVASRRRARHAVATRRAAELPYRTPASQLPPREPVARCWSAPVDPTDHRNRPSGSHPLRARPQSIHRTDSRPEPPDRTHRRALRRLQPRGPSTRSLTVPSGNANGARTPVWATASGRTSGPSDGVAVPGRTCGRHPPVPPGAGISTSSIVGSPSTSIGPWTTPTCS